MEEQEVLRLFGLFTGLSEEEAAGWAVLCRSTIAELTGRLRPGVDPASDANRERLSAAAAAMAAYRYRLLGAGQTPDSLKVGEITLTSGAAREESALPPHSSRSIWQRCVNWWTPEHSASKG